MRGSRAKALRTATDLPHPGRKHGGAKDEVEHVRQETPPSRQRPPTKPVGERR
jgi:hypothetical protein